jgi:hypothetical protein
MRSDYKVQALSIVIQVWIRPQNAIYKQLRYSKLSRIYYFKHQTYEYKTMSQYFQLISYLNELLPDSQLLQKVYKKLSNYIRFLATELTQYNIPYSCCKNCGKHVSCFDRIANSLRISCSSEDCRTTSHVLLNVFYE